MGFTSKDEAIAMLEDMEGRRDAAKEIFMNDVNGMEDSDFKEFCLEYADEITSMEV